MKKLICCIITLTGLFAIFTGCASTAGETVSDGLQKDTSAATNAPESEEKDLPSNKGYLIATDYVPADGVTDVSDTLQDLILKNPNSTIYFPDGVYILRRPIMTPSNPDKSVDLQLSNFACLKASDNWKNPEAMIRLGAIGGANNISTPGSNYGISGGIIDGSGRAKGISIDGGRETYIRNVNIKNVTVGIHIKYGANSGSSDSDIHSVNIYGTGSVDSVGVLLEGHDNTLTNMRIGNVFTGVDVASGGNMLRNIHPLFINSSATAEHYEKSVGFLVRNHMNWFDYCYSDQFAVAFHTWGGGTFKNCFCYWYSDKEPLHVAFKSDLPFFGSIDTLMIGGSHHPDHPNQFMDAENISENGVVENVFMSVRGATPTRIR